jgi:general secretion pathway protein N
MSGLCRVCVIGCFWLIATASAFAIGNRADIDISDTDAAAAVRPQPSPAEHEPLVAQTGQPPSGNPLWRIPLNQLSETRDRPIFSQSRRPPAADAPATAVLNSPVLVPKQPERPPLSLIGTIVNGRDGFAIFVDQTTKAALQIRMGADYRGWMLRQIEARSVTLQKGQDVAVLSFPQPANDANTPIAAGFAQTPSSLPAPAPPLPSTAATSPHYLSPESNALRMPTRSRGSSARRR